MAGIGKRGKTEHVGAKHGNGAHWGSKGEAKQLSAKARRQRGKREAQADQRAE